VLEDPEELDEERQRYTPIPVQLTVALYMMYFFLSLLSPLPEVVCDFCRRLKLELAVAI
jgi:hypothetical protein